MARAAQRQSTLVPNEGDLLNDALHSLEQVLVIIGEDQPPTAKKRESCACKGAASIDTCPIERRFKDARDVVKRGKERA